MKNRYLKKITAVAASFMLLGSMAVPAFADNVSIEGKKYISLGADLNTDERATVLSLLNLTEDDLANYQQGTVTNADEYTYLSSYLDASVIGDRALSSVRVDGKAEGYGLQVATKNITYCTEVMYQNALATAGVKNADIVVAGPYQISGTAALVGAMKAYEAMTGVTLSSDNVDTATNELVTTTDIADSIGSQEKAEELIGALKDIVVSEGLTDPDKIDAKIDDTAKKLEITLTEEEKQQIKELLQKISNLDLDVNQLKEQAKGLYDKLSNLDVNLNISQEQVDGIFAQIGKWFEQLWGQIQGLFS
ncbi:MAG: DUF1002 domain-containing protein [Lachnospiraceae bacterium]|nr:DUF1002 domain-containing protein [Lachnospiraceae bacterium]